jgi:SAM-dependent methyltransferase
VREAAASTEAAIAALEALREGELDGARLGAPEALAVPGPPQIEHDPPPAGAVARPLLDHAVRGLRNLATLERGASLAPLGDARFARTKARLDRVAAAGLLPALRVAMLHLDVCKGGTPAMHARWRGAGIDVAVHNLAGARVLALPGAAAAFGLDERAAALAIALVESHGLAGQRLRGETPLALFAPWIAHLRGVEDASARGAAIDALHVIDVCDTAAVRAGLVDDALADGLDAIRAEIDALAARAAPRDVRAIEDELAAPAPADAAATRAILSDRLARLRVGRQRAGEARADVEGAVASLTDDAARALERALAGCQLWYCESATGLLAPAAQLGVLATVCAAARTAGIDLARPWHAQLHALVAMLGSTGSGSAKARYRRRLVESGRALGTFESELGGARAIVVDYRDSEEAAALITLLAIYEKKSSARFHATLKALCDLYDLRKDDFDRLSNEHEYLAHMNSARSDKARMLDYVRTGRILEVGPGGGVVLDLLEDRFPDAEVIGLDASAEVCDALAARRARDHRRWRVVHADAFALPDQLGAGSLDTVVFCSVLHEIYSYVVRDGRRFRLESVRDLLRAAWTALRPGGRIVIRDGIMPPPGTRRITFTAPDGREFFDLFVRDFEGRPIPYRDLADRRIELASGDAMEFLYTYTWGPASFPYEVREQYGVMTYADYGAHLVDWLPGARLVPLPPEIASYLQPGYEQGLADKIALTDEHDAPARLPDSNCLLVVEKATRA